MRRKNLLISGWLILACAILLLAGCGTDSTPVTGGDVTVAPYGVTSNVYTADTDGDGFWDYRTTTTFSYDAQGRVVGESILEEWDYDADGVVDEQQVVTTTYDPDVALPALEAAHPTPLASGPGGPSGGVWGAPLTEVYQRYVLNASSELVLDYEDNYVRAYDAAGYPTQYDYVERRDNDLDGVIDYIYRYNSAATYDAQGRQTAQTYGWTQDDNGDSIPESGYGYTRSFTYDIQDELASAYSEYDENGDGTVDWTVLDSFVYTYDEHGNPTAFTYLYESDTDADGTPDATDTYTDTYVNSYDAVTGKLIEVNFNNGEQITTYSYYESGELYQEIISGYTGISLSTRETDTYEYNAAGQLNGLTEQLEQFDAAELLTLKIISHADYVYDEIGRMTSKSSTYTSDGNGDGTPESQSVSTEEYSYNADNKMTAYTSTNQTDNPYDGTIDSESSAGFTASYNSDGNLAGYQDWWDADNNGTADSINSLALVYSGTRLTSLQSVKDYDTADGVNNYISLLTLTYDAASSGRLTGYVNELDWDADGNVDVTITTSLAYSGSDVTVSRDSGSSTGTFQLSFGALGIPTGLTDVSWDGVWVDYPQSDAIYYETVYPLPDLEYLLDFNGWDRR